MNKIFVVVFLVACVMFLTQTIANPIDIKAEVATELIILHNNDMHARFEQTNVNSGKCLPEDANSNKCYGGFARVAHEVRKYREEANNGGTPVLYLNAGDTYTGTPWFTVFKDNITAAFLNMLKPDAISLGNHEFDEKVEGLIPFLNEVDFPVVTSNLDFTNTPELATTKSLKNSTVLEVNGVKIGVIGYLTPDTAFLVSPNSVQFKPEIECINEEAAKMKAAGINIIIALGHSGYHKDQEIAIKCPDIDIVIGGHSHTFLYTGTPPDKERAEGPYPTVVKKPNGKEVPVVQAYAYTKYLGKMHLQFDKDGNLIEFDGTPILLNAQVARDNDFLQLLEVYRPNITALEQSVVGHTKVQLDGHASVCRTRECNLGNMLADSMIYSRVLENQGGTYWTDAPIAFINGGSIRNSIEKRSDGSITENDVLTVLPFNNKAYITKITGKTIRNALQHSADIRDRDSNGGFLQMSGVHVTYDFRKGKEVAAVEVRCGECDVPAYEKLDDAKFYNVIVSEFMMEGGDQHVFTEVNGTKAIELKLIDTEMLAQYLKDREFVYPEVEGRIVIIEKKNNGSAAIFANMLLTSLGALLAIRFKFI